VHRDVRAAIPAGRQGLWRGRAFAAHAVILPSSEDRERR
jgi:hypothetical protein